MEGNDSLVEYVGAAVRELCELSRDGQALVDLNGNITHVVTDVGELADRRPELTPELLATVEHLQQAGLALARCAETCAAMAEVRMSNAFSKSTPDEGGPS